MKLKIMKKLLLLLLCVTLFGCSGNRVLLDELSNKGTGESPTMYYEGKLFSGIGFRIENGQLESETNFENGKKTLFSTGGFILFFQKLNSVKQDVKCNLREV